MKKIPNQVLALPWFWAWDPSKQVWRKARIYY